jgi:hypothetical protein
LRKNVPLYGTPLNRVLGSQQMPTHIRAVFILHIFLLAIGLTNALGQLPSFSVNIMASFAICGWFALVAYGIWAQVRIVRYALWINGLFTLGSGLFAIAALAFLSYNAEEASELYYAIPFVMILIQTALGAYIVFVAGSEHARNYFSAR